VAGCDRTIGDSCPGTHLVGFGCIAIGRRGIQRWVIDLRDTTQPCVAGVFIPNPPPSVFADEVTLGSCLIRMWSSLIIRDGLIYVVDIRNGLSIERYTGLGAATIAEIE